MGCHTWFYRRVALVQEYESYVKNGGIDRTGDWGAFESEGALIKAIQNIKWMLANASSFRNFKSHFEADLVAEAELHKEGDLYYQVVYGWNAPTLDGDGRLTTFVDGIYYQEINKYHDLFRSIKYDTILKTKEETLKFLKENHIRISKDNKGKLLKFWEDYPNGLIELG